MFRSSCSTSTPKVAREGLERARKLKPDPFFTPAAAALVTTGGFDADLDQLKTCDWIVEAVVERLDVKQALLARVEAVVGPDASSAPTRRASRSPRSPRAAVDDFRRHWLGTHFFNPPRYLQLLEIIPTAETDPAVVERRSPQFADRRLGKGVVVAKDTPNFIANHIGCTASCGSCEALETGDYTIEEIDAITGPAIGRPKSATFRTMDIAGVDVLRHVLRNLGERPGADEATRQAFAVPPLVARARRARLGRREGRPGLLQAREGRGRQERDPRARSGDDGVPAAADGQVAVDRGGESDRERPASASRRCSSARTRSASSCAPRWARHSSTARRSPPRSPTPSTTWTGRCGGGSGGSSGPFETWDAIGVKEVIAACGVTDVPPLVQQVLDRGANRFRDGELPAQSPELVLLKAAKEAKKVVKKNPGASLVDLGDGVLCLEFHSKMNAIGGDTVSMMMAGVKEAEQNFKALVVGNDAQHFSAGANLMLLLLEAQEGNWDEVDLMIRAFQNATMALRYANVPVVVAPAGLTLGGGCEMALHGAACRQPARPTWAWSKSASA